MKKYEYPEWFINEMVNEEDKQRAKEGTLNLSENILFKCYFEHTYLGNVSNRLHKKSECPLCSERAKKGNVTRIKKYHYPEWFLNEIEDPSTKEKAINGTLAGNDVIQFRCSKGHYFTMKVSRRIKVRTMKEGKGCPECNKLKSIIKRNNTKCRNLKFPQWFIDELAETYVKERALNGMLPGMEIVKFKCSEGHFYNKRVCRRIKLTDMTELKGCPICSRKHGAEIRKTNIISQYIFPQWFINDLFNEEDKQRAIESKISSKEKLEFICKEKHHYIQTVSDHICIATMQPRYGCPECGKLKSIQTRLKTLEQKRCFPQWFIDDLFNEEDKQRARLGKLIAEDIVSFICSNGHIYKQRVGDHITISTGLPKYGCLQCSVENSSERTKEQKFRERPEYPQWFINLLVEDRDIEKAKNKTLITTDIVKVKCDKGHIYTASVNSLIEIKTSKQLRLCPICYNNTHRSKNELYIESYINNLGFPTIHSRKILNSKQEIDIFIPDKNIAIEYNGSFYHRTIPEEPGVYTREQFYHRDKFLECKNKGIHLISIFDVDWETKKNKILNYIQSLLLKNKKIHARKCSIQSIENKEANKLYEEYHLLGKTPIIDVSYGLFYNGELISCMSFQKGRYKENKESVWCLTRFVTKSGFIIVGGASKLLTQFEKEYVPKIIISYSDNDYFTGSVYSKLGFQCLGDTNSPRYYWFLNNKEIKREQCQLKVISKQYPDFYKEALLQKGNKEDYIMLKLGALKVYRSGNTKWIKK